MRWECPQDGNGLLTCGIKVLHATFLPDLKHEKHDHNIPSCPVKHDILCTVKVNDSVWKKGHPTTFLCPVPGSLLCGRWSVWGPVCRCLSSILLQWQRRQEHLCSPQSSSRTDLSDTALCNAIRKKICRWRYLPILGVKVITHLGQSDGASRAHLPSEGRHLRHTEPRLDGKSPAAGGGEPPLWIIRHVSQFTGC